MLSSASEGCEQLLSQLHQVFLTTELAQIKLSLECVRLSIDQNSPMKLHMPRCMHHLADLIDANLA